MAANKPAMIGREQNSVLISWKNVESLSGCTCMLQMLDDLKRWKMLYWGPKNEFKIKNLAPCTCYDLRIKNENDDNWISFRAATLDGSYMAMHMSRAIKFGKTPLIRKIAHAKPHLLEVESKEMKTPLAQAVEKGDLTLVNLLINLGANVNTLSLYNKKNALMHAISLGQLQIANLLIDKGSNIHNVDIIGLNILHYAVDSNNIENVKFALKQSVCVDAQDCSGWTPLLRAVELPKLSKTKTVSISTNICELYKNFKSDTSKLNTKNVIVISKSLMHTESTSTFSFSDSDESVTSRRDVLGIPDIFVPGHCINRTVVVKSIKKCNDEVSISFQMKDRICRICHGGRSSGDLITPCKCKGSIALAHLHCLEIWLNESNRNECELCQYHFRIIRQPKYSVLKSIFMFLRHPGVHLHELIIDLVTLIVYTPSTITSTYMLMLLCESIAKSNLKFRGSLVSHIMAFTAIFGIAAINFTYTSWLVLTLEKYVDYWREWYKRNCSVKVILSSRDFESSAVD